MTTTTPLNLDWKKMQQDVTETAQKVWLASLGTVAVVEEQGSALLERGNKVLDTLVTRGKGIETRGKKGLEKVTHEVETQVRKVADQVSEKVGGTVDRQVTGFLHRVGVPSRVEIETLTQRVAELTEQVDRLVPMLAEKANKAAAKA